MHSAAQLSASGTSERSARRLFVSRWPGCASNCINGLAGHPAPVAASVVAAIVVASSVVAAAVEGRHLLAR